MSSKSDIIAFYNNTLSIEKNRPELYPVEFTVTMQCILERTRQGDLVLDTACGPGHQAAALIKAGRRLFINDISKNMIDLALECTRESHGLVGSSHLDIGESDSWKEWPTVDAILLLGPFCHMANRDARRGALKDAISLLKSSKDVGGRPGWIFVSYLSACAAIWYSLETYPEGIVEGQGEVKLQGGGDLGWLRPPSPDDQVPWFFAFPNDIQRDFADSGLVLDAVLGLEGILGRHIHTARALEDTTCRSAWMNLAVSTVSHEASIWVSEHLLAIGKTP